MGEAGIGKGKDRAMKRWDRVLAALVLSLGLSGCGDWLGDSEDPPLPGKRIAVLSGEPDVEADAAVSDVDILLPRPYINTAWPQAGGYPTNAMYHLTLASNLRLGWSSDVGAPIDSHFALAAEPVLSDQILFTLDSEGRVSAVDTNNGNRLWSYFITPEEEEDSYLGGGIGFHNGVLVVTTSFAQVLAMRAVDGAILWRARVPGPVRSAPTISGGRVFVTTLDNRLIALSLRDGSELWNHSSPSENAALLGGAPPAADGEIVVVPYSNGDVFGLAIENGRVLWSDSIVTIKRSGGIGNISDIRAKPVIDRDMVFIFGANDRFLALDRRSGARLWEKRIGGLATPWMAGDFVYLVTSNGELMCLLRKTGRVRWIKVLQRYEDEEDQDDPITWMGPILASDRLLMTGSHGEIWAIDAYSGTLLGAMELDDRVTVPPILANGALYVLENDGYVYAYR